MEKILLNDNNVISPLIEKMVSNNKNKKQYSGHTLSIVSIKSQKFISIKDGILYIASTLKEFKEEFEGYALETQTLFKYHKNVNAERLLEILIK